ASDTNYTLWINGKLALFGQYADYPDWKICDDEDITEYLLPGENLFAITVWYYGIDTQTYITGKAGLIFEVTDGKGNPVLWSSADTLSRLSRDYQSGREEMISGQLGPTYHYDMNGYDGFREGKSLEGFRPSDVIDGISTDFSPRPCEKLILTDHADAKIVMCGTLKEAAKAGNTGYRMQYAELGYRNPVRFNRSHMPDFSKEPAVFDLSDCEDGGISADGADGLYFIVDLGKESAGFLDLDIEVEQACFVDVGFGEHLNDGRLRTDVRGFYADFKAAPGRNRYLHTFRRFGCRYLQFFVHAEKCTVRYAGLRPTLYPLVHKEYRSGNVLRDEIYRICQNTLQQCLHEHYEDCPWREQALYCMDSRNQMLCGYYAFGEYRAARASLELISHGVRPDGLLSICYPSGMDFPIPSFSCVYFIQMEEYIRYSKDLTLAREKLGMLKNLMAVFTAKLTEDGIIDNFYGPFNGKCQYWNFYEWTPTMSGTFNETKQSFDAPINAFLSIALQALAGICEALGDKDAQTYSDLSQTLNRNIKKMFFNEQTKLFESFLDHDRGIYTTLTQALCTLCGAAEDIDKTEILRVLASNGKDHEEGLTVWPNTLSMNSFRFDALLRADREKYAPVILEELDRDYLYMIAHGATSFWETIEGADCFGDAGSLCHGWSALPVYYYETLFSDGKTN
ncbi:MAG: hypothetical protein IJR83_08320, partial [Clostridia bacterium]|nr:hypothetical protein [Clostridia bacterium]